MNRQEVYRKAMVESIKNSGMWLKEAKIVAKKASKGHAQALTIFAGEELGKAVICWLATNGVFPYNHPEVDFQNKRSVFRQHPLKNATAIGFSLGLLASDEAPEEVDTFVEDYWTGEPIEFRYLLLKMGAFTTWARSTWMYVDINQIEKGQFEVSSPLEKEPYSVEGAIEDLTHTLKVFKKIVRVSEKRPKEFEEIYIELKTELMQKDNTFPKRPK